MPDYGPQWTQSITLVIGAVRLVDGYYSYY